MSQTHLEAPTVAARLIEAGVSQVTLGFPGTDYRLRLAVQEPPAGPVGREVHGTIHARARRVDVIEAGGRFVEPSTGRPRRVQGRVVGANPATGEIAVQAGPGICLMCTLTDARQKLSDFTMHQMVSFDVEPGAVFRPA